jgi:hypothetical protein
MSKTSFQAAMIKDQLEKLHSGLKEHDQTYRTVTYILNRLWPELEAAIEHELPESKSN